MSNHEDIAITKLRSGNPAKVVHIGGGGSYESLAAAKSIEVDDNGKTFGLNLAAGFTTILPKISEVFAGWKVRFRVETAPTGAYIITEDTTVDTNVLTGGFSSAELTNVANAAYSAAFTQVNLVANQAAIGDYVDIECNGSRFFVSGHTNLQAGVTAT